MYIEKKCPNCKNMKFSILSNTFDCSIIKCNKCTLIMKDTINILTKEAVQQLKDNIYTCLNKRLEIEKHNKKKAEYRLNLLINNGIKEGKLLEIGCATGEFIELAKNYGFDVLGIDTSVIFIDYLQKKGISAKCGLLEEVIEPDRKFDVITMFHLIEHVEDPENFLLSVSNYLKDKGVLYIICPNVESITNKLFGYQHPDFQEKDHLFFYSKHTLSNFLQRSNFSKLSIFSKEYTHNIFTSIYGYLSLITKRKSARGKENHSDNSLTEQKDIQNVTLQKSNRAKLFIYNLPFTLGKIFYPLLRPYGYILEKNIKGQELIVLAKK